MSDAGRIEGSARGHLFEVSGLKTQFLQPGGVVKAVDGVSYHLDAGEVVAFVGESGSGKSVTQYSGLQLIETPPGRIVAGTVMFDGSNLLAYAARSPQMRDVRGGRIGIVFQEPMTSLNPVMSVGRQIEEPLMLHLRMSRQQARARAIELMNLVGIPDADRRIDHFPHQFSGGMRQRVMIAMAVSCNPRILIADEATTALDVTTQAQILELLRGIVKGSRMSLVLVTHNLGIVARYADRIYVMYAGEIVESGTAGEIFGEPRHPYTAGLLKSIPSLSGPKDLRLTPIDGIMPDCVDKADICQFLPRCSRSVERCRKGAAPRLAAVDGSRTHLAACYVPVREAGRQHAPAASRAGSDAASRQEAQILEVRNLKIHFPVTKGFFRRRIGVVKAVDDVTFSIERGKTLGLVGESGCGKTTVARSVLRLYRPTAGQILFEGRDIAGLAPRAMRKLRRNMSLVFQDPYSSLDPRQKAADIVGEPLRNYRLTRGEGEYRDRIEELFRLVGLDPSVGGRVPHEFSGGQRQRIGIARALATSPSLIVCDEAISALDVSIQAQIINLLEDLQHSLGLAYLFIAHDLSVVRHISDHVAVMYLGKVVEHAAWRELYEDPLHPYTQALLAAVPVPDPAVEARRTVKVIKGEVPSLMNRPPGCVFSNRCPLVSRECTETEPALRDLGVRHFAACIKA